MNRYLITLLLLQLTVLWLPRTTSGEAQKATTDMQIALWSYQNGKTAECFAEHFLTMLSREGKLNINRSMKPIALKNKSIFNHPIAILSGSEVFNLSPQEINQLTQYLTRGGFLIASAGCSHKGWQKAFTSTLKSQNISLRKLPMSHQVFHTLYDIEQLRAKEAAADLALRGIYVQVNAQEEMVGIYSPMGLNDTKHAGGGCCCCGANELKDASRILSNIILHALTP